MAVQTTYQFTDTNGETQQTQFGVGDVIRVHQRLFEADKDKSRIQVFEGIVISIRGKDMGKSAVVRRIGAQNIGMEMIFPLNTPTIEKIEVTKTGVKGVRRAKLYYIREKSRREIDKIYSRTHQKDVAPREVKAKKATPKTSKRAVEAK